MHHFLKVIYNECIETEGKKNLFSITQIFRVCLFLKMHPKLHSVSPFDISLSDSIILKKEANTVS